MTREDELVVLQKGIKSDFWKLIEEKFLPHQKKVMNALLSQGATIQDRDRLAERLSILDEILTWPQGRIETLEIILSRKEDEDVPIHDS